MGRKWKTGFEKVATKNQAYQGQASFKRGYQPRKLKEEPVLRRKGKSGKENGGKHSSQVQIELRKETMNNFEEVKKKKGPLKKSPLTVFDRRREKGETNNDQAANTLNRNVQQYRP